jgi:hypothetical protein
VVAIATANTLRSEYLDPMDLHDQPLAVGELLVAAIKSGSE